MPAQTRIDITATFPHAGAAEAAVAALLESGIRASSIDLQHNVLPEATEREGKFVWRVLVSITGALPGAVFGFLLSQTIGPGGPAGLILQVVCWTIVGHLIGGMLAGYALLADRSEREMPPNRPLALLTVTSVAPDDVTNVERLLRSHNPLDLRVSEPDAPSRSS